MDDVAIGQILDARSAALAGCADARRRIAALVDDGSFVEYGPLAGRTSGVEDSAPADGLVAGVGAIDGHAVVAAAYDRGVLGGTQSDRNQRKLAKLIYLARTNRWPLVVWADGDGARRDDARPVPPIVVYTRGRWDVYDGLAELSGWVPTVAVVPTQALDGHAGLAFLCDVVIGVSGARIGSDQAARPVEEHAARGDVDLVVDEEEAAIAAARRYLRYWFDDPGPGEVAEGHAAIDAIVPENRRRPYDMRKLIDAFADAGSVMELGRVWAPSMITSLARLGGRSVGIFANQPMSAVAGAIDSDAADKAARFVELCDAYELPLISFVDNPGYMVGPDAERAGIARHHAAPAVGASPPDGASLHGAGAKGLRARALRHVGLRIVPVGARAAVGVAVGGVGRHVARGRRLPGQAQGDPSGRLPAGGPGHPRWVRGGDAGRGVGRAGRAHLLVR